MKVWNTHQQKDYEMTISFVLYEAYRKYVNVNYCKIQNCLWNIEMFSNSLILNYAYLKLISLHF
jgi:hypothetical protein